MGVVSSISVPAGKSYRSRTSTPYTRATSPRRAAAAPGAMPDRRSLGRSAGRQGETVGYVVADIDPAKVAEARGMIPALRHDRKFGAPELLAVGRAAADE